MEEDRLLRKAKGTDRILDENVFFYLLDLEVKRARRYQNFLSLVLLNLKQVSKQNGEYFQACQQALGRLLSVEMRETDVLGSLRGGRFALLLPYADPHAGNSAKSRLESVLKCFDFMNKGFAVMIDEVCFPVHAMDPVNLIRQAMGQEPCGSDGGYD